MCFAAMTVSKLVENPSDLKVADHIKWKRSRVYDHHAIVDFVNRDKIRVIEYGSGNEEYSIGKLVVRRRTVSDIKEMYKYDYDNSDVPHEVLQRARSRLGERKYNLCTNNCEHFARWCKTGQGYCTQIRCFIDRLRECCSSCQRVLKRIFDAIANGGIKVVAVLVLTELISFSYSCYKAQKAYKDAMQHAENDYAREIFKRQRNRDIKEAGSKSALAVACTATGALLGSLFPVVGTGIGAVIGYTVGRLGGIVLF